MKNRHSKPVALKKGRGTALLKHDPSRTLQLRQRLCKELRKRFARLKASIILLIDREDALGLVENRRWEFQTSPEKVKAFQDWLRSRVKDTKLDDESLWRQFVMEGFRKGQGRAFEDATRAEKAIAGGIKEKLDFYEGTKEQFLKDSFNRPETIEKVKLLAGRSYTDLDGVTDDMETRLVRSLTEGLVAGKNPRDIARDITDQVDISRSRAELIARTEIVRAHAEGQLDALQQLGVDEVGVAVEWLITDDDRVCDACADMSGVVLKVSEAHNLIPRHPNCRCSFIPANVGEEDEGQKRSKEEVEESAKKSAESANDDFELEVTFGRPESVLNYDTWYDVGLSEDDWELVDNKSSFFATCERDHKGHCIGEAGAFDASPEEYLAAAKLAKQKVKNAPVPTPEKVAKMRAALERAKNDPKARAGGDARGSSADRRARAQKLFAEFGGNEKGYVVCPHTGLKMHWSTDPVENPKGYPKFEQGKIFTAYQGGGYQLPNLLPESFTANRSRNDTPVRKENLK